MPLAIADNRIPREEYLQGELDPSGRAVQGRGVIPFRVDLHVQDDIPQRIHEIIRSDFAILPETFRLRVDGSNPEMWRWEADDCESERSVPIHS